MLIDTAPDKFPKFLKLIKKVYTRLKKENPRLKLFVTIQIDYFHKNPSLHLPAVKKLLRYSDIIAVSTYPYLDHSLGASSKPKLPKNWFSKIKAISPRKPFAIAETAFPAEDSLILPQNIQITSTSNEQAKYLAWMLNEAHRLNGEFVTWLTPRDVDQLYAHIQANSSNEFLQLVIGLIKDTGLLDEDGKSRKSFRLWKRWLNIRKARR